MLTTIKMSKIWLCRHRVDFRKGHDGLLAEAYKLGLNPFNGDVVLFIGRCRKKVKALAADSNGLWVCYKKFSNGSSKADFNFLRDPECRVITPSELAVLLDGCKSKLGGRVENFPPNS